MTKNTRTAQTPQSKPARGIRNNNPLNIRIGNTWLGEVTNPTDSEFEQFVSILYGLRAAFVILRRYIRRYGRNTVRKIIHAWAPRSENDTDTYVKVVATRAHIDPDAPIDYADEPTMVAIVRAMAFVECHADIPTDTITKAYQAT